ncbi:MAG: VWA domain-containing protein [Methanomassiliicoccales archaeon]|nr:MAG: VWA domain-containing protein [Methanomassiliicoccales archaeon]
MKLKNLTKRSLSVYIIVTLVLSNLFGFIPLTIPISSAAIIELSHDAGNLDFNVDNYATLPFCIKHNNIQQSDDAGGWIDHTFFFFDQSQYDHGGGRGDIATGRFNIPWSTRPDFETTASDVPLSFLEDGTIDTSYGSLTKTKDINGQANDIRLFQTAWSKSGEDWGIIEWTVQNLYDTNLTAVRFGLRFHACINGDNADDKAFWEPADKVYYLRDSGSTTYFGFASADPGAPVNVYWDGPVSDTYDDNEIAAAAAASPYVSGHYNDLGCVVGWTDDEAANNGFNLSAKEIITRPLIMAVGSSYPDLLSAITSARQFYLPRSLHINEIADEGTPRVEIHTTANVSQALTNIKLSVDGGSSYWSGGFWNPTSIPANGYSVWTLAGGDAFNGTEGDTLGLYQTSPGLILCDEVGFGQEGIAPDPIDDSLIGSISRTHISDWVHSLNGTTFGAQNNEKPIDRTPEVVLNEVMFNPDAPEYGFIELMYIGRTSIDLDGFSVVTDDIMSISGSYILDPDDPYFLIFRDDAPWIFDNENLSSSGDNVYLYDNDNILLDMVGWNTPHQVNKTVSRVPDGEGTYQGYRNVTSKAAGWVFDQFPTIPLVHVSPLFQFEYCEQGDEVWYDLTITNRLDTGKLFDIFNYSLPGWQVEVFLSDRITEITDSDDDGIPDIIIGALASVDISIKVTIPSTWEVGDYGNVTISVKANPDPSISQSVVLQSRFFPYLTPGKSVTPSQININGTGYGEQATITLNVTGNGFGIPITLPQDVVFVVDRSDSLLPNDIRLAKEAITDYVDNMSSPDSGAVVYFNHEWVLMSSLTSNYNKLKNDISNIPEDPDGQTYMGNATLEALQELIAHGDGNHIQVIILLTDGGWTAGSLDPIIAAQWARENDTFIYTIGLGSTAQVLKDMANITGGEFFYAETADDLKGIYQKISSVMMDKTAGYDPDPTDANPMIRDVLPPWIDYVPGSFSLDPDNIYESGGYTYLEWNLYKLLINETWEVTFNITSSDSGYLEANNYTSSRISYFNWEDVSVEKLFPKTMINVIIPPPPPPPEPLPPELFIEVVDDPGNPDRTGDNIRLYWLPPSTPEIAYYLIYRSENQRDFDFSTPWVRTNISDDNGVIPLRTTWNDTHAAKPGDMNYYQEIYYIIRTVNTIGNISSTSRTVGKWTKGFFEGVNTFSLPLEPLQAHDADWYTTDMGASYIKWMNTTTQTWMQHDFGEGADDNSNVILGEGYEVNFASSTKYTFCGMPGAMIQYDNNSFKGFNWSSDAMSLTATVEDFDVVIMITLNWARPMGVIEGVDEYRIYYSTTRDGFWGTLGVDYIQLSTKIVGTETATHTFLTTPNVQYYYMVVPVLSTGQIGTSTYSSGVWISDYKQGYDTVGLPLKLPSDKSVDWYCDAIPDTLGMNYYNITENRWMWHKTIMPAGVYDVHVKMAEGYQILTLSATKYIFKGF